MKYFLYTLVSIVVIALIGFGIYFTAIPSGRAAWNSYQETLHKVDDSTTYETQKKVEDECRAMISSYNQDKTTYLTFKDSEDELEKELSRNALIRANNTANTYNNYILKNSYVWSGNVPSDICSELEILS